MKRILRTVISCVAPLLLYGGIATAVPLDFTWDDPNNDPSTLSGYRLERSTDDQRTWTTVVNVPVTPLTASDNVTVPGKVCWRVLALAGEFVSPPSNVVCVTFPHAPVNVTVQITLSGVAQ